MLGRARPCHRPQRWTTLRADCSRRAAPPGPRSSSRRRLREPRRHLRGRRGAEELLVGGPAVLPRIAGFLGTRSPLDAGGKVPRGAEPCDRGVRGRPPAQETRTWCPLGTRHAACCGPSSHEGTRPTASAGPADESPILHPCGSRQALAPGADPRGLDGQPAGLDQAWISRAGRPPIRRLAHGDQPAAAARAAQHPLQGHVPQREESLRHRAPRLCACRPTPGCGAPRRHHRPSLRGDRGRLLHPAGSHLDRPLEAPRLGNRVNVGAGAKILGGVTIGDDACVGANAVVLDDVPAGATVVGVPAHILSARSPGDQK